MATSCEDNETTKENKIKAIQINGNTQSQNAQDDGVTAVCDYRRFDFFDTNDCSIGITIGQL